MSLLATLWLLKCLQSNQGGRKERELREVWQDRVVWGGNSLICGGLWRWGSKPDGLEGIQLPKIAAAPRTGATSCLCSISAIRLHSPIGSHLLNKVIYLSLFWDFYVVQRYHSQQSHLSIPLLGCLCGSTIWFSTTSSIHPSSGIFMWFNNLVINKSI